MLGSTLFPALWSIGLLASTVFGRHDCSVADVSIIAHDGESVGTEEKYKNGMQKANPTQLAAEHNKKTNSQK